MDEQIENWLSSAKYAKGVAKLTSEFSVLDDTLISPDPQARLSAARRLSTLSRSELSWFLLPVRDYFLDPRTQRLIAESLRLDADGSTRDRMLNALRHASERFIEHPMWSPMHAAAKHDAWRIWVHGVAESFRDDSRSRTRGEAAYLLAYCSDQRSWDLFLDTVRSRPSLLPMLHDAVIRYPHSISTDQRRSILALVDEVAAAHPRHEYDAAGIRAALTG